MFSVLFIFTNIISVHRALHHEKRFVNCSFPLSALNQSHSFPVVFSKSFNVFSFGVILIKVELFPDFKRLRQTSVLENVM